MISYAHQSVNSHDAKRVAAAVQSAFLTTGPEVTRFEEQFARFVGAKFAVAVSSGTAALHLAYRASGLCAGDEVVTTPLTFCATANAALYWNAKPIFADIRDDNSGLINVQVLARYCSGRTKIIAPVHYAGQPCDLEELARFAKGRNITVIEDASHALGARYKNTRIGDCRYSDLCTFSFHPVKHITTGEGGMMVTNRKDIYERVRALRNHGLGTTSPPDQPWLKPLEDLGFNYRLTDVQSALGTSQLRRYRMLQARRMALVERYNARFSKDRYVVPATQLLHRTNAYHLYVVLVENAPVRAALYGHLKAQGILCQVHYLPVYRHPYYESLGYRTGLCPNAEKFYARALSLPLYPDLKFTEQDKVIGAIRNFFRR